MSNLQIPNLLNIILCVITILNTEEQKFLIKKFVNKTAKNF